MSTPTPHQSLVKTTTLIAGEDPWAELRRHTSARLALGRSGGSQRTTSVLDFRQAHAAARDAVHATFSPQILAAALAAKGIASLELATRARNRADYLMRPDLGRALAQESVPLLSTLHDLEGTRDLVIILSDGLSATAAHAQAVPLLEALLPLLAARGISVHRPLLAPFARVKLQDEVGAQLGCPLSLMLLGERPGLGTPDSLGAYLTWKPGPERTDADRNCVSNIRPEGLPPAEAAERLARLLGEALRLGCSGVALKDNSREVPRLLTSPNHRPRETSCCGNSDSPTTGPGRCRG